MTLSIPMQRNGNQVKLTTSFTVPYHDWGMKNPSSLLLHVKNEVAVSVISAGQLTETAAR